MSTLKNVVLPANGKDHIYTPVSNQSDTIIWRENTTSGSLAGQPTIRLSSRLTPSASGINKMRFVIDIPAESALGFSDEGYKARPKVDYSVRAVCEFYLPSRSTAAQRNEVRNRLIAALGNEFMVDAIDNVTPPF